MTEKADPSCTCKVYELGAWKTQIEFDTLTPCPFHYGKTIKPPTPPTTPPQETTTAPAANRPAKPRTNRHGPGNGQQSII